VVCSATADFVDYHGIFSPDKIYCAQVFNKDREAILVIKNQQTNKNDFSISTLVPAVQHVQWSPDSQSLVIVAHISGGSLATIIQHHAHSWECYNAAPPLSKPYYYFLVGIKFLPKRALLTYGVYPSRGSSIREQEICIFTIDYNTGLRALKK